MSNIKERLIEFSDLSGKLFLNTKIHFEVGNTIGSYSRIILVSLFTVFLCLKVFKILTWSWWVVFSPILFLIVLILVVYTICFILLLVLKNRLKKVGDLEK